ncbi:MAG TPA: hypothetical protein VN937_04330 [Blastocatellia bacterium]|nr:hypothetical protein [Blastocatellia bacterium]
MREIDWAAVIADEDVEGLWNGLYQLVSRHPAVRPLHFATDGAAVTSQTEINADLTQELFLELFQKQRFDHYAKNRYKSIEIENELARIELPNLVGARLRKRYPESFRMARRVSALLKTSKRFKRFGAESGDESAPPRRGRPPKKAKQPVQDAALETAYLETDEDVDELEDAPDDEHAAVHTNGNGDKPRRRRMVNQVFGLREWPRSKRLRDSGHFTELIKSVPMMKRDTRLVGRSGTSQLILSNPEMEKLIVRVLAVIDSPADVKTIRQLVLSKIPLQDYNVSSLDEEMSAGASANDNGSGLRREARDTRDTPEELLLRGEKDDRLAEMADEFLSKLRHAVNNNERRYTRLLSTLWHCYYNPRGPSQLEIAELLGVSDSLVSDNRRLIEHELKKLKLTVEDGGVFSESLQRLITQ